MGRICFSKSTLSAANAWAESANNKPPPIVNNRFMGAFLT